MKWIGLGVFEKDAAMLFYCLIMMIYTVASNVLFQYYFLIQTANGTTEEGLISTLIGDFNQFAFAVGIHLTFYFTSGAHWQLLLKLLKDITINPEFLEKLLYRSRIVNTIGMILLSWVRFILVLVTL